VNRYAWRGSEIYDALVRDPQNKLLAALPPKTQLRYAEIRALVAGVTAIQGTGGPATVGRAGWSSWSRSAIPARRTSSPIR
jgi:5-methylthioadenosine/S-adenosylhomocysteine deaminase